ncbi:MAG: hypothetical protein NWR09_02300 [Pseudomonadales bacterium]|jgi:hypothetical protein|nr:hypothetical protein [Pseudomonadales bacterium]
MPHEIMEQFIHQLVIDPPQPCYHDAKVDKQASGTFSFCKMVQLLPIFEQMALCYAAGEIRNHDENSPPRSPDF